MRHVWIIGLLAVAIQATACSPGGSPSDSGTEEDGNGHEESSRPDLDLDDDFAIEVPTGARACTLGHGNRDPEGALEEYRHTGRITFRSGLVRLPRGEDTVEADWIESIELGPQRMEATPAGAGTFTRTLAGTAQDGVYRYLFLQAFLANGDPFEVSFTTEFEVRDGVPTRQVLVLDTATLSVSPWNPYSDDAFQLQGRWQDGSGGTGVWTQRYTACETTFFDSVGVRIEIAGSDTLELDYRCPEMAEFVINTTVCSCPLVRGKYTRGGVQHEVTDFFRLLYTAWDHCTGSQASLVVFDPPVEGTGALFVSGGAFSIPPAVIPDSVSVLNGDFEIVDTLPITGFERS